MLLRSRPSITLSFASSKSAMSTACLLRRAASSAASLTMLDSSAPESPGVPLAIGSRSTLCASGILRVWTRRICSRPLTSGMSTTIWRSNRPGRSSAGSRMSGRLVAASRMTPSFDSKPSISTSSWLSVCSRSSCPPPSPAPRCRPTASISSMNTMQGACFLPCSNRSRTRDAPTPTNISTKSEPLIEKNGTFASAATARASSVLPVPGGPIKSTPFGMRPPSFWNFSGSLRNAMISCSSALASSTPATSLKVTFFCELDHIVALLLPNEEDQHADEQQDRRPRIQQRGQGALRRLRRGDGNAALDKPVGQPVVLARRVGPEAFFVGSAAFFVGSVDPGNLVAGDRDLLHLVGVDVRHELAEGHGPLVRLEPGGELRHQHPDHDKHHPEQHPFQRGVHPGPPTSISLKITTASVRSQCDGNHLRTRGGRLARRRHASCDD